MAKRLPKECRFCADYEKGTRGMHRKKILSIEDHIPKFKENKRKKHNRRLIICLSIFFLLIFLVIYIQSPLSRVHTVKVNGNALLTEDDVQKLSGIDKDTNIWSIRQGELEQKLEKSPLIKKATVARDLPNSVSIDIKEYKRIAYVAKKNGYEPLFASGKTLDKFKTKSMPGDAPALYNFKKARDLKQMASELEKLNPGIRNLISEIHVKKEQDKNEPLELYMNDGLVVNAALRDFSKKMEIYPSIASQIKPGTSGIIHIGVGAYFEKIDKPGKNDKSEGDPADESVE